MHTDAPTAAKLAGRAVCVAVQSGRPWPGMISSATRWGVVAARRVARDLVRARLTSP